MTSRAVSPGKFKMAALGKTKISTSCDDHWKNWQQSHQTPKDMGKPVNKVSENAILSLQHNFMP